MKKLIRKNNKNIVEIDLIKNKKRRIVTGKIRTKLKTTNTTIRGFPYLTKISFN